jgi:spore maturation protein CgeB
MFFERDVPYYSEHRDLTQLTEASLILYNDWKEILPFASRSLEDADVGLVTSYCGDAVAACELVLDSCARLRVFYDLDAPITLETFRTHGYCSYLPNGGLSDFDLVLSYTGGLALSDLRTQLGARRVASLYGSVDPLVHRPVFPSAEYRWDLSHLGTYAEDRRAALDELLIEPASRCPHQRFLIGGPQYPSTFMWRPNIHYRSHVSPAEHSQFYCASRFTLNVTRLPMARLGFCPSNRLFEAAACAVPILTDPWEGLDQFFDPDSELIVVRCAQDVVDAIGMSDEERKMLGKRARERALLKHTAAQRAIQMENLLESALAPITQ